MYFEHTYNRCLIMHRAKPICVSTRTINKLLHANAARLVRTIRNTHCAYMTYIVLPIIPMNSTKSICNIFRFVQDIQVYGCGMAYHKVHFLLTRILLPTSTARDNYTYCIQQVEYARNCNNLNNTVKINYLCTR